MTWDLIQAISIDFYTFNHPSGDLRPNLSHFYQFLYFYYPLGSFKTIFRPLNEFLTFKNMLTRNYPKLLNFGLKKRFSFVKICEIIGKRLFLNIPGK